MWRDSDSPFGERIWKMLLPCVSLLVISVTKYLNKHLKGGKFHFFLWFHSIIVGWAG